MARGAAPRGTGRPRSAPPAASDPPDRRPPGRPPSDPPATSPPGPAPDRTPARPRAGGAAAAPGRDGGRRASRPAGRPVWRILLNAVPGPLLAWVNKWLALLDHLTLFSNPAWLEADRNAAALSVPAVLLAALLCRHQGRATLLRALRRAVAAVAAGLALCAAIRLFLSLPPARPELDDALGMVWETLYVLTIVSITVSITVALLVPPGDVTGADS